MEKIRVMIAGLPGKMASLVAEYVVRSEDMELIVPALSEEDKIIMVGSQSVSLIPPSDHELAIMSNEPDIIVDFTLPGAVNRNAELYCECGTPFVMGTTGGDRDLLKGVVQSSSISAVIAPNMAKQIVAFQAMMEYVSENFPDVFKEYKLTIRESHQEGKADTSGTAKHMVECFNKMGIDFERNQIVSIRNPNTQRNILRVPKECLSAHGWHNYELISGDETVFFRFTHNINGRDVYAQGTLDAIRFLFKHKHEQGKVYSMIDVLKAE